MAFADGHNEAHNGLKAVVSREILPSQSPEASAKGGSTRHSSPV